MKILVVGSGAREHALAWRLSQSSNTEIFATPGNPGIAKVAHCLPGLDLSPKYLLALAETHNIDLTVVGPEAPLVAGVVNAFRKANHPIIGPTAENAALEGSKIFAKNFFRDHNIPTPYFKTVTNVQEAQDALAHFGYPVVIKTDGLAAGKGVVIASTPAEAEQAILSLGPNLVIEEFLTGPEVSFIALCDGNKFLPFMPTRDHKRIYDGDKGPNTGGMGAFCDPSLLTSAQTDQILDTVIEPTVRATRFTGFLYAGIMMTPEGPRLLEYNVRMGDPETQPLMCQIDTDFVDILMTAARGQLSDHKLAWKPGCAAAVVLAAPGYPGTPRTGDTITGIDQATALKAKVFHAGTQLGWSGLTTAGGRVLTVAATGSTLEDALTRTYTAVGKIKFDNMQFRTDIGRATLNQLSSNDQSGT